MDHVQVKSSPAFLFDHMGKWFIFIQERARNCWHRWKDRNVSFWTRTRGLWRHALRYYSTRASCHRKMHSSFRKTCFRKWTKIIYWAKLMNRLWWKYKWIQVSLPSCTNDRLQRRTWGLNVGVQSKKNLRKFILISQNASILLMKSIIKWFDNRMFFHEKDSSRMSISRW